MQTRLLYLENMCQLSCTATVLEVIPPQLDELGHKIVVDQTVFYPQGGGQPSDRGTIQNTQALFEVNKVFVDNEIAYHAGFFKSGQFSKNNSVELHIDPVVRELHNKNHTAGHLIDYALANLGYKLESGKAYHFPQGPYVEYLTTLEQAERDALIPKLEQEANRLVAQALPVCIAYLDNDPKKRSMSINNYPPILCGGTHVLNTSDIGSIIIRKIKNEKGNLRVSYAVQ